MTILIIVLVLLAIPFILAIFTPAEYIIERQVVINKPKAFVYDYLRLVRNGEHFNKWVMMDPKMKKEFKGTDGTVGFVYAWDSDMRGVGKGEQEIKALKEGERIDYELRFYKPFRATSFAWFELETVVENQTRVKWVFRGVRNFMMKVMHNVINFKKILGKDLQTSLDNLKALLER